MYSAISLPGFTIPAIFLASFLEFYSIDYITTFFLRGGLDDFRLTRDFGSFPAANRLYSLIGRVLPPKIFTSKVSPSAPRSVVGAKLSLIIAGVLTEAAGLFKERF